MKFSQEAINIIRLHHPSDSVLAAALSNYASCPVSSFADWLDLSSQKRFEDARLPCSEALRIFLRDLGHANEYTRSCFANMYQILKQLNMTVR